MDHSAQDERAILRLLANYCALVDDGEFAGLLDCFTADAEFVFEGRARAGHARLLRFFEATGTPDRRGKHMTSNAIIDVDGDSARATSDFVFFGRSGDGFVPVVIGRYHDDLHRENGCWRFSRRDARTL